MEWQTFLKFDFQKYVLKFMDATSNSMSTSSLDRVQNWQTVIEDDESEKRLECLLRCLDAHA